MGAPLSEKFIAFLSSMESNELFLGPIELFLSTIDHFSQSIELFLNITINNIKKAGRKHRVPVCFLIKPILSFPLFFPDHGKVLPRG